MDKQFIVTISREYGSHGHEIAEILAKRLGVKLYDRAILDEISKKLGVDPEKLKPYEESPTNLFLSRRVGKFRNSMEEALAEMQFDFIKEKADSGESFVIVGRCADSVLHGRKNVIKIFITGCKEQKIKRVMEEYSLSKKDAADKMRRVDLMRKLYHNRHSSYKWGDSRYYDVIMNSRVGSEHTADALEKYIIDVVNSL